jgi:hypothetical protein
VLPIFALKNAAVAQIVVSAPIAAVRHALEENQTVVREASGGSIR